MPNMLDSKFKHTCTTAFVVASMTAVACMGPAKEDDKSKKRDHAPSQEASKPAPPAEPTKVADSSRDKIPTTPAMEQGKPNPFKKGQVVPPGLSPEMLEQYAEAQGDPLKGKFTLEQAFEGAPELADKSKGKLFATLDTDMGKIRCELFEDKVPVTIANFVGLGRGVRPWLDKKTDTWITKPYYDGVLFHRVIENFMLQTGDHTNSGTGGPGYLIVDELDKSLRHNKAGILSMANRGPNTGSSQFFVTVRDTPHLDDKHTVFGQCDTKVAIAISKVKVDPRLNDRPFEPVSIKKLTFDRGKK